MTIGAADLNAKRSEGLLRAHTTEFLQGGEGPFSRDLPDLTDAMHKTAWVGDGVASIHMHTHFPFLNAGIFLCCGAVEEGRLLRAVLSHDDEGARNGSSRILPFPSG